MKNMLKTSGLLALALTTMAGVVASGSALAMSPVETPYFEKRIAKGKLPLG